MTHASISEPALELRGLTTEFRISGKWYPAIRDVSLQVMPNETLAVVGESGSGKSITALSVLGLLPARLGRIGQGQVLLAGQDLTKLPASQMRKLRGNRIAMVFQEPMTSLNPTMNVGEQIAEVIRAHEPVTAAQARGRAVELLRQVGIPSPDKRVDDYPHQFSGGMRQRVMIAIAIACRPDVLLADEPTTALDVTIQAQVLAVLQQLKEQHGMAMLFITHNLGVVALIADRVAVMYAGEIVELAAVDQLFSRPAHPYTEALLAAMPRVDRDSADIRAIPGSVPPITQERSGCVFAARCTIKQPGCETDVPPLTAFGNDPQHQVRCFVRGATTP